MYYKGSAYSWVTQINLGHQVTLLGAIFSANLWAYSPHFFFNDTVSYESFLGFTKLCLSSTSCLWSQLLLFWVQSPPTLECRGVLLKMKILVTTPRYPDAWLHYWNFTNPLPVSIRQQSCSSSLRSKFSQAALTHIDTTCSRDHELCFGVIGS